MKRGNTALKRGVAIAAAFTTAIAGAVLAAPAASAAPTSGDIVRVIPVADSGWVGADGSINKASDGKSYGPTTITNATNAPTVLNYNSSYQGVRGLQIALPGVDGSTTAAAPAWSGKDLTVTLAGADATFAGAPSKVSIAKKPVLATAFDTAAGVAGTHSTNFVDATGGTALTSDAITKTGTGYGLNADKDTFTIKLPTAPSTNADESANVYVLTIDGIALSVPKDYSYNAATSVVTAAVGVDGAASGKTTLGVVNPYVITTDGDTVTTSSTTTLPDITVTELVKDAFNSSAPVKFSVTGTDATGKTFTEDYTDLEVKSNSSSLKIDPSSAGTDTIAFTADSDTKVESFTVSGITVTDAKPGTDITVSVLTPAGAASVNKNGSGSASGVSFVADLTALTSVKLTPTTALPRLAGSNRYATAADIASKLSASDAVVIANGEDNKEGIDALAANYLAAAVEAPILLTQANTLPKETEEALTKLFKASAQDITVYVMGKTDSVSQAVRDKISATIKATASSLATVKVKEIAGGDRYETSAKAAAEGEDANGINQYDLGEGSLRTAFLASGQSNADALAAGAVSAAALVPVLLATAGDELPASVSAAINSLHIGQVVILGSTDRVSAKVEADLKTAGVNVVRLAGTGTYGRYDTAVKIAHLGSDAVADGGFNTNVKSPVFLANGAGGFADALSIGPLAGAGGNVVLTVPSGVTLPPSVAVFLAGSTFGSVQAVGGTDRVSDAAVAAAEALVS